MVRRAIPGLARIADFLHAEGAAAGIQLAHAGAQGQQPAPLGRRRAGDRGERPPGEDAVADGVGERRAGRARAGRRRTR